MVEVVVARLGLDATNQAFVVMLQERDGDRLLPIWIGRAEADAIAAQLHGVRRERPMTHDLAASLVPALGGVLRRVQVTRVVDGTYFGELLLARPQGPLVVDARPSDAIALALRLQAPIYVAEALFRDPDDPASDDEPRPPAEGGSSTERLPGDDDARARAALQRHLEQLRPEDFGRFLP